MAYDAALATRIRDQLSTLTEHEEKQMFGGLCFLVGGHMCAGIVGSTLMLRVGTDRYEELLARPHVREMDFTGRALRGMVYVEPDGIARKAQLASWLRVAYAYVGTLPPKKGRPAKPQTTKPRPTRKRR